jgi:hypothetical protein
MTTNLDTIIAKQELVRYFSELQTAILENRFLSDLEKKDFINIWNIAIDFENWNHSDLALGCKKCQEKLKETSSLSDKSIEIIVKLASYEWK